MIQALKDENQLKEEQINALQTLVESKEAVIQEYKISA
jgi:hypothetical protein